MFKQKCVSFTWKQPMCPSTDEWIKKPWCIIPSKGSHMAARSYTDSFKLDDNLVQVKTAIFRVERGTRGASSGVYVGVSPAHNTCGASVSPT